MPALQSEQLNAGIEEIAEKETIMYHYTAYGLKICSGIPCPQLITLNNDSDFTPDIHIRYGKIPKSLQNPIAKGVLYQARPDEFLLQLDEIGGFWVRNGKEIIISPAPDATDDEVNLFLFGSAFGALLHQRGFLVLHASAIASNKGAVLFIGPSGNGKSTTAAAFHQCGYRVLSDDICALTLDEKGLPLVIPSFPQIKIWADAAKKMKYETTSLRRVRPQLEKYALPVNESFCSAPLPLSAVYYLGTNNKAELKIEPIEDSAKFKVLLSNTYRARFMDGLEMRDSHFKLAIVTANTARIQRVTRPSGAFQLDELISLIKEDLAR
ncbi:MAG: hypothetical protein WBM35_02300 [Candidatus Electrothrix sp.]